MGVFLLGVVPVVKSTVEIQKLVYDIGFLDENILWVSVDFVMDELVYLLEEKCWDSNAQAINLLSRFKIAIAELEKRKRLEEKK